MSADGQQLLVTSSSACSDQFRVPQMHMVVDLFVKWDKNGCLCIVEIRGLQGCALFGNPARAVCECRAVSQCTNLIIYFE